MWHELFAVGRAGLGAYRDTMASRYYDCRITVLRSRRRPVGNVALDGGINILGDDRLDGVLRPRMKVCWARTCRGERAVRALLEANNEISAAMVSKRNDLLCYC